MSSKALWLSATTWIELRGSSGEQKPLTQAVDIQSSAEYILLVEKETVFQRLANDGFCKRNLCIVMTGRGYPDVATRSFLRLLNDNLNLPIFGLVDGDPHGIDILLTYTFGSMQMAYDAGALATPGIHWLGAHFSDCETFDIPQTCLLPLSIKDKQKAHAILNRNYMQHLVPAWREQIMIMLSRGVKFEVEAISASSFSMLSDHYLPVKIKTASYF